MLSHLTQTLSGLCSSSHCCNEHADVTWSPGRVERTVLLFNYSLDNFTCQINQFITSCGQRKHSKLLKWVNLTWRNSSGALCVAPLSCTVPLRWIPAHFVCIYSQSLYCSFKFSAIRGGSHLSANHGAPRWRHWRYSSKKNTEKSAAQRGKRYQRKYSLMHLINSN